MAEPALRPGNRHVVLGEPLPEGLPVVRHHEHRSCPIGHDKVSSLVLHGDAAGLPAPPPRPRLPQARIPACPEADRRVKTTTRGDGIVGERSDARVTHLAPQATQILQCGRSSRTKSGVIGPGREVGWNPQWCLVAPCVDVGEKGFLKTGRPRHTAVVEPGTGASRIEVMVTEPGVRRANEAERATFFAAKQQLVDAGHEADRRLVERVALDLPCRTTVWVEHLVTTDEDRPQLRGRHGPDGLSPVPQVIRAVRTRDEPAILRHRDANGVRGHYRDGAAVFVLDVVACDDDLRGAGGRDGSREVPERERSRDVRPFRLDRQLIPGQAVSKHGLRPRVDADPPLLAVLAGPHGLDVAWALPVDSGEDPPAAGDGK